MARRSQKTAPVVSPDAAVEQPLMVFVTNPISVANTTPKTRDEISVRDAIRAQLAAVESAIAEFVAAQTAEGFSMTEINELYTLELPVLFGYRADGSKIRAQYDAQIVERAS